jgi:hypothetical protein
MAIQEQDLRLPALLVIEGLGEASTTQLQTQLREVLKPTGEDLLPLENRNDDRFSQKVRNLKSHETLLRRGWVLYESRGNNGYWRLTPEGSAVLDANRELLDALLMGRHQYVDQQAALADAALRLKAGAAHTRALAFDEDESVLEGKVRQADVRRRVRSRRLREAAMQHFGQEGRLICAACEFDFEDVYGERGAGYIEVHHIKPIFMYEEGDLEQTIDEALENLAPLCSNCHRMVHRRRSDVWTVEELRACLLG